MNREFNLTVYLVMLLHVYSYRWRAEALQEYWQSRRRTRETHLKFIDLKLILCEFNFLNIRFRYFRYHSITHVSSHRPSFMIKIWRSSLGAYQCKTLSLNRKKWASIYSYREDLYLRTLSSLEYKMCVLLPLFMSLVSPCRSTQIPSLHRSWDWVNLNHKDRNGQGRQYRWTPLAIAPRTAFFLYIWP